MDYIIVGAGPSGLTAAWLLAKQGKKCLIIDSNASIGGCHRVSPDSSGAFGEHGPRVYSDAYKSLRNLLEDMGGCFNDFFVPYNFSISNLLDPSSIGRNSSSNFTWLEIWALTKAFFALGTNPKELHSISMLKFMQDNNFSAKATDYVDRLCRLTDGAGADRYSLHQFLQLINQQSIYKLYQPNRPNDQGLFAFWRSRLEQCGVQFLMSTKVRTVALDPSNKYVTGVSIFGDDNQINAKSVILAIPPVEIYKILLTSGIPNAFGFDEAWTTNTNYIPYQNIVFHWDTDVLKDIQRVWGFPKSNWGVAHIVLSDYFSPQTGKTIISTCTTIPENYDLTKLSQQDFIDEVFNQLKLSYPNLPQYTNTVVNAEVDTAYIAAAGTATISHRGSIQGLYNIGTHNGNSYYSFTSMESAVGNAIHFVSEVEHRDCDYLSEPPTTLWQIIILFVLICILSFVIFSACSLDKEIEFTT